MLSCAVWLSGFFLVQLAGGVVGWVFALAACIGGLVAERGRLDALVERADESYPVAMRDDLREKVVAIVRQGQVDLEEILLPAALSREVQEHEAVWVETGWKRGYLAFSGEYLLDEPLALGAAAALSARGYLRHREAREMRIVLAWLARFLVLGLSVSLGWFGLLTWAAGAFGVMVAERSSIRELALEADIRAVGVAGRGVMLTYLNRLAKLETPQGRLDAMLAFEPTVAERTAQLGAG